MDNAKVTDVAMNLYNLIEYKKFFCKHLEVCGHIMVINQLQTIMTILLMFLLMMILAFHLNIKNKISRTRNHGKKTQ